MDLITLLTTLPCLLFIMQPTIHNPGHTSPEDSVATRHCFAGCSWPWNMLLFRLQRDLPMTPARRWSNKIKGIKLIQHLFHNQIWIRDSTGWPKKDKYEKTSCNCPHCDAQQHHSRKTSIERAMLALYMAPRPSLQLWKFLRCQLTMMYSLWTDIHGNSCLKVSLSFPWVAYSYFNEAFSMWFISKSWIRLTVVVDVDAGEGVVQVWQFSCGKKSRVTAISTFLVYYIP